MAYYDYDNRYHQSGRHDSYYTGSRDVDGYSKHASTSNFDHVPQTAMYNGLSGYTSSYDRRSPMIPPSPERPSAQPSHYADTRSRRHNGWPPFPSAEDEVVSLAREFPRAGPVQDEESGEARSRGSVDQYPIIEEIEQFKATRETSDDRRFVLVSDPSEDTESPTTTSSARERRRRSFAERGNIPHLKTDIDDPPVFTKRTSTPYAYTKPQKESIAPSAGEYSLSPEPVTPSANTVPRSVPSSDTYSRHARRDQNANPSRTIPVRTRYDSLNESPKSDVFEDSDVDEDAAHLRTERQPARYSFVKSDLQKDDLRTSLLDGQAKSDKRRSEQSSVHLTSHGAYNSSPGSSRNPTPRSQSPRSSASSLHGNGTRQKPRPDPLDTGSRKYSDSRHSRPTSPLRPSSPSHRERMPSPPRSPRLPPRPPVDSPSTSRPTSRSGAPRPPSPLSSSTALPSLPPRVPVTEAEWHATYPPAAANDRSRPLSRFSRHESLPIPAPRIDVQSPSPARPLKAENPLPYPVDDRHTDVFMPPEHEYQYDHSQLPPSPSVSRQPYPDSPQFASSPAPGSPHLSSSPLRPAATSRHSASPEEVPRVTRVRSDSIRSQSSHDGRRSERRAMSLDKPLPSCPRSEPSAKYDDWYTLENCPNFDICPSCFKEVFADTLFAGYFKPVRRHDLRFCDFSSPWMRLAWLLTIKQQRKSPDLLYALATISDLEHPCPNTRELSGAPWYGIPDQRDGIHVANFTVCPCDVKMIEVLFPSIRGYMTRVPPVSQSASPRPQACSLRIASKRFPKYLDLLVELDEESRAKGRSPDVQRFINMAREHAYKDECSRDKPFIRKPWHFIPNLPEFTVCEECYDDVIWPAIRQKNSVAKLFLRNTQLVPGEDNRGTSCCLYSPRMRRIWDRVVEDDDFGYLKRKAMERKKAEMRLNREKSELSRWLETMELQGGFRDSDFDRLRRDLRGVDNEWKDWE